MLVLGYQSISQWVDIRQLSPVMSENQFDNVREPATRGPAAKSLSENKPVIVALALVGLLIITFVGYQVLDSEPAAPLVSQPVAITTPEPVAPPLVPEPEPPVVAPPSAVNVDPVPVPEPAFILPRLDDSDQLVRDGMLSLTREEAINTWLSPAELVRKFVVLVDNVANGNVRPNSALRLLMLPSRTHRCDCMRTRTCAACFSYAYSSQSLRQSASKAHATWTALAALSQLSGQ